MALPVSFSGPATERMDAVRRSEGEGVFQGEGRGPGSTDDVLTWLHWWVLTCSRWFLGTIKFESHWSVLVVGQLELDKKVLHVHNILKEKLYLVTI